MLRLDPVKNKYLYLKSPLLFSSTLACRSLNVAFGKPNLLLTLFLMIKFKCIQKSIQAKIGLDSGCSIGLNLKSIK